MKKSIKNLETKAVKNVLTIKGGDGGREVTGLSMEIETIDYQTGNDTFTQQP